MLSLRSLCRIYYADLDKMDIVDRFTMDYNKMGFIVQKFEPGSYGISITGEGNHYSRTLKGLHPHIRRTIANRLAALHSEFRIPNSELSLEEGK